MAPNSNVIIECHQRRQLHLQDGAAQRGGVPPEDFYGLLSQSGPKPAHAFAKVFRTLLLLM